jgi:hypothetical protein
VQCVASSQCRCGECVNGMCNTMQCADSNDCRGNQCCTLGTCLDTRCEPNLHAGDGLCCDSTHASMGGVHNPEAPARSYRELWILLAALACGLASARLRVLRIRATAGSPSGTAGEPRR